MIYVDVGENILKKTFLKKCLLIGSFKFAGKILCSFVREFIRDRSL